MDDCPGCEVLGQLRDQLSAKDHGAHVYLRINPKLIGEEEDDDG